MYSLPRPPVRLLLVPSSSMPVRRLRRPASTLTSLRPPLHIPCVPSLWRAWGGHHAAWRIAGAAPQVLRGEDTDRREKAQGRERGWVATIQSAASSWRFWAVWGGRGAGAPVGAGRPPSLLPESETCGPSLLPRRKRFSSSLLPGGVLFAAAAGYW